MEMQDLTLSHRPSSPSWRAGALEESPPVAAHMRLKLATRPNHDRIDRAVSGLDLARHDDYAAFLRLNAAALGSLRSNWRLADEDDFNLLARSLAEDLAALGADGPAVVAPAPGPIDGLGLAYVVRGSRLGSKILRQRVRPGLPTAYLDVTMTLTWRSLLRQLDACADADPGREPAIVAGARATFAVYAGLAPRVRKAA